MMLFGSAVGAVSLRSTLPNRFSEKATNGKEGRSNGR